MIISFSDFDRYPISEVDFCCDHSEKRRISLRVDDGSGNSKKHFVVYAKYWFPTDHEKILDIFPFSVDGLRAAVNRAIAECPSWLQDSLRKSDEVLP